MDWIRTRSPTTQSVGPPELTINVGGLGMHKLLQNCIRSNLRSILYKRHLLPNKIIDYTLYMYSLFVAPSSPTSHGTVVQQLSQPSQLSRAVPTSKLSYEQQHET